MARARDLIGYLFDEYKAAHPDLAASAGEELQKFIEHSRQVLQKTPPTGVDYSVAGLGLIFPDGLRVTVLESKQEGLQEDALYEPEIPVTYKNRQ